MQKGACRSTTAHLPIVPSFVISTSLRTGLNFAEANQGRKRDGAVAHVNEIHVQAMPGKNSMITSNKERGFPFAEAAKRNHQLIRRGRGIRVQRVCTHEKRKHTQTATIIFLFRTVLCPVPSRVDSQ